MVSLAPFWHLTNADRCKKLGVLLTLIIPYISYRTTKSNFFIILTVPFMIIATSGFWSALTATIDTQPRSSSPLFPALPLMDAQVSVNVVSDKSRLVAVALVIYAGTLGGLISS